METANIVKLVISFSFIVVLIVSTIKRERWIRKMNKEDESQAARVEEWVNEVKQNTLEIARLWDKVRSADNKAYEKNKKDLNEVIADMKILDKPSAIEGWKWLSKDYPEPEDRFYTVLDKYGNTEKGVLFGCSRFMNEPFSFFEGNVVKAKDIVAYREE